MGKAKKVLVFRLSAMGDVSLTVPTLRGVLESNPDIEITLVTRKFFAPFFYDIPRLTLFFPDLKGRHRGLTGLIRLFLDLNRKEDFSVVIDLHRVIRTRILTELFILAGKPGYTIDKGRKEKKYLLRTKYLRFLKHSSERYLDTFEQAGLSGKIGKAPYIRSSEEVIKKAEMFLLERFSDSDSIKIGLAPFATHKTKIWGTDKFKELITFINDGHKAEFYLFGGGEKEISKLKQLQEFGSNIHLVAGNLNLEEEIGLIKRLNLMISMDSSNMHLAALSGIPTISIWGGTHPVFGFSALGQPAEYHIQIPASTLKCRPCSVYGAKPCIYPEPICLDRVKAADVYATLRKFDLLKEKSSKTVNQPTVHSQP